MPACMTHYYTMGLSESHQGQNDSPTPDKEKTNHRAVRWFFLRVLLEKIIQAFSSMKDHWEYPFAWGSETRASYSKLSEHFCSSDHGTTNVPGRNTSIRLGVNYSDIQTRCQSNQHWPKESICNHVKLAEAGFYYNGEGYIVKCFSCGSEVRHRQHGMDPWKIHNLLYQPCALLAEQNKERLLNQKEQDGSQVLSISRHAISQELGISEEIGDYRVSGIFKRRTRDWLCFDDDMKLKIKRLKVICCSDKQMEKKRLRREGSETGRRKCEESETGKQVIEELGDGIFAFLQSINAEYGFERMLIVLKKQKGGAKVVKLKMKKIIDRQLHSRKNGWGTLVEEHENSMKTMKAEKSDDNKKKERPNRKMKDRQNSNGKLEETEQEDSVMENGKSYTSMNEKDREYSMEGEEKGNFKEKKTSNKNMNMEEESLEYQRICKICLDTDLCMIFFPCRHLVACEACSDRLTNCAVCRSGIRGSVKVNFK